MKRKKWTCDACGKVGCWGDTWSWYGSIAHEETCPDDLICACSDKCAEVVAANVKSGKWRLPVLRSMGASGMEVIRERVGYPPPSADNAAGRANGKHATAAKSGAWWANGV